MLLAWHGLLRGAHGLLLARQGLLPARRALQGLAAARGAQGLLDLGEQGLRKQADSGTAVARTPPARAIERKALSDFLMSAMVDSLLPSGQSWDGVAAQDAR